MKRWGDKARTKYRRHIFKLIRELPREFYKLWLLCDDTNTPIYGCLCFYYNNYIIYWHGAGDERHFNKGVSYNIIEHGVMNNHNIYDFNPSGGLEGVARFKQGFGPDVKNIYKYSK